jgi:hypothetical protein
MCEVLVPVSKQGQGSFVACGGSDLINTRYSRRFPKWRLLASMAVVRGVVKSSYYIGGPDIRQEPKYSAAEGS